MAEGLRRRLREGGGGDVREPVAIVGIGCRFPGAVNSPGALWKALAEGMDAIAEIPPDRFDAASLYQAGPPAPGRIGTRWGGFLDGIDRFDADFFATAPREAERLDPQQRLLLEVAWEALEDGCLAADRLAGSRTGVFVGVWLNDFESRLFADPAAVDFYMTTGSGRYSASGRVSYALGLQGPSITVDTACSSSLVAVHLACQSLWSGESEMALAAGANVILQPHITIAYSQSSMMAPDGRCKFGDARANGYVRSEGAAAVLLKPLSRALSDGDPVYAVIRGSAVNNDGRSGEYMATPAQAGQEQMLRLAYQDAGVSPGRVAYVEAHGTGTAAGDPVELGALGAVLGEGRSTERPCAVGSIKTNLGHTEGAAGVAGLIKTALVLRHGVVPASLHFQVPNPAIPWDRLGLYVPSALTPLDGEGTPAIAGVSSFGIAGTNAHVVLEAPPPGAAWPGAPSADDDVDAERRGSARGASSPARPVLVPLSARSPEALAALAGACAALLDEDAPPPEDLAYSAGCRRAHLETRAAFVAGDRAELEQRMRAFAAGEPGPGVVAGRKRAAPGRVAFVFPGQGSQWQGMAQELLATEPVFREAIEACEAAMRPFVDWSLPEQLLAEEGSAADLLQRIDVVQPVLVAVDVALAALWRAWGVEPDAVVGHSMGEVAAAHVAGALSLEDAMRVVCLRSQLMRRTSGQGAMAVVELSLDDAAELVSGREDRVSVGASNSPRSTILSGDPDALQEILEGLEAREIFCRRVNVDVASHSPQMDPLRAELLAGLREIRPRAAGIPIYSTVTGAPIDGDALGAEYWTRNLRQPVLFSDVVERLLAEGYDAFVEASPHPVLLPAIEQTARAAGRDALTLPSLRREEPERATLLQSLGALFVAGTPVDFARLHPGGGRLVRLPLYPWQRERFWYEPPVGRRPASRAGTHPLLGAAQRSAAGSTVWEADVGLGTVPFLADHRVRGSAVLPATAYLEMVIAAAAEAFGTTEVVVRDVAFEAALFLPEAGGPAVQVVVDPDGAGTAAVRVFSRAADAEEGVGWTLNARATLLVDTPRTGSGVADAPGGVSDGLDATGGREGAASRGEDIASGRDNVASGGEGVASGGEDIASGDETFPAEGVGVPVTREDHYGEMAARGLDYGASFQALRELRRSDAAASARLEVPGAIAAEMAAYRLHPALLDACFQLLLQTADASGDPSDTYLPSGLDRFEIGRRPEPGEPLRAYAVRRPEGDAFVGDVALLDEAGATLATARGLRFHRLAAGGDPADWVYAPAWMRAARAAEGAGGAGAEAGASPPGVWLLLADGSGVAAGLAGRLEALGGTCVLATPGGAFERLGPARFQVDPTSPDDLLRVVTESAALGPLEGVAHLWSLDLAAASGGPSAWEAAVRGARDGGEPVPTAGAIDRGVIALLHLVQAVAAAGLPSPPRICLVTAGAQPVRGGEAADPLQAALWGMAGVLVNEHPELRTLCVDLDPENPAAGAATLIGELRAPGREDRLAFRGGERWAARLARHDAAPVASAAGAPAARVDAAGVAHAAEADVAGAAEADVARAAEADVARAPAGATAYRVVTTLPGVLDNLTPRWTHRLPPAPGQVEIEVRATGLNFMNVMSALGIYPGYPDGVGPLGIECAGVVARVGEGVDDFRPGDEVVAYAFDSLATHALADRHLVAPKPRRLGFAEAATLPIAFLTAHYALVHLARLEAGERVLIHAATGGVGLAALQLARRAGAHVFATAGSDEKRDHLRTLGVEHVFDSRSLAFADEILERTGGEGVDVVLNSLAGPAIARGLRILRPYGRFVEIGKRDIYDDARVGLAPFRKNLSYFAVDLERMARERPAPLGAILRDLVARVEAGDLEPLPLREFATAEVGDAFRHMAQAHHIGKVVVRIQDASELEGRILPPDTRVRPDATYLITGGLGGLGLAVAARLVEEGARHLLLIGRSGAGEAAMPALRALEAAGAEVRVAEADVTRAADVRALLERTRDSMPPLRGVVHAAGLLADGTVLGTEQARFRLALAPKIEGALSLHALTLDRELDFFVLFSSVAALLGTPGQANYAAANAFLDGLAHARRAAGLPALSIGWGPWSDVGLAAARSDRGQRLAGQGLGSLTPEQGTAAFGRLNSAEAAPPQLAVMRFDLGRWSAFQSAASASPYFDLLREAAPAAVESAPAGGILDTLDGAFGGERRALLERYLQERVAQVLRLAPARVALDRPLKTMGMDSLMTLELRNRLEAELGLTLSATVVWNYPTVELLAGHLADKLAASAESAAGEGGRANGGPLPPHDDVNGARRTAKGGAAATSRKPPRPDHDGPPADPPPDMSDMSREELESMLANELAGLDDILGEG